MRHLKRLEPSAEKKKCSQLRLIKSILQYDLTHPPSRSVLSVCSLMLNTTRLFPV